MGEVAGGFGALLGPVLADKHGVTVDTSYHLQGKHVLLYARPTAHSLRQGARSAERTNCLASKVFLGALVPPVSQFHPQICSVVR